MITGLYLKNGQIIITLNLEKISPEDYTEPDLLVEHPYEVLMGISKIPYIDRYLSKYTDQNVFSFRSEDVLTVFKPNAELCKEYVIANGIEEQLELQLTAKQEESTGEDESL